MKMFPILFSSIDRIFYLTSAKSYALLGHEGNMCIFEAILIAGRHIQNGGCRFLEFNLHYYMCLMVLSTVTNLAYLTAILFKVVCKFLSGIVLGVRKDYCQFKNVNALLQFSKHRKRPSIYYAAIKTELSGEPAETSLCTKIQIW
jgi:hypothetical protein